MSEGIKVRELYEDSLKYNEVDDTVEMVDIDDEVDPCWGLSSMVITEEQVEELKNGKAIYFSDGEYAHVIALEKAVKEMGHTMEAESKEEVLHGE